jgi:hypothetical protein
MPATSKQQFKFIWAMRRKFGSKKKAPKKMKWVFDEEWTKGVKFNDLPKKIKESQILNFEDFIQNKKNVILSSTLN